MKTQNKKAAMEMSIGTIVTIVLLMSVLVLGLVLVRSIFTGATGSVDDLDDKVKAEINNLFAQEDDNVVVKLGSDKKARVKAGTADFGVAIGASTYDGSEVGDRSRLQYRLELGSSNDDCVEKLGDTKTANLIKENLNQWNDFEDWGGPNAYARILFSIPKGTALCTQKILIDVRDTQQPGDINLAGTSFRIQIIKSGLF